MWLVWTAKHPGALRGGEEAGHSGAFPRAARAEEVAGRGIL